MTFYTPEEDSFLLRDTIKKYANKSKNSLEIGVGGGIVSKEIAKISKKHLAVDINPWAIKEAKSFLKEFKNVKVIKSDLFSKVPSEKFDLIVFNPPYLPSRKDDPDDWITKAIVGGKKGYETILGFIDKLDEYLSYKGACYLLFSSLSKPKIILEKIDKKLLQFELKTQKTILGETLFVYKIKKDQIRIKLEKFGLKKMCFFAKGKRGKIFTGIINKKKVGIKIIYKKDAMHSLKKEIKNLKIVNKINVGPKLIKGTKELLIYEFLEGDLLISIQEKASKNLLKKIVLMSLKICRELDLIGFEKKEMTNPYKHIIVGKEINFVDFERGILTKNPGNVTQFLQYLSKSSFSNCLKKKKVNLDQIWKLGKKYKEKYSEEEYNKIVLEIKKKFNS